MNIWIMFTEACAILAAALSVVAHAEDRTWEIKMTANSCAQATAAIDHERAAKSAAEALGTVQMTATSTCIQNPDGTWTARFVFEPK